jgi:hypothetical protein
LTHLGIKALGQGLVAGKDCMNGKIAFGKYIPYKTVDVSCLVDVGGGKDLAAVLVENVDKQNLEEISQYVTKRASKTKKGEDQEHKQRNQSLKYLPPM